jgi:tetratricopeptide (TPR) repeat protein
MRDDERYEALIKDAYANSLQGKYGESLAAARSAVLRAKGLGSLGLELRATRVEASTLSLSGSMREAFERLEWVLGLTAGELPEELREIRVAHAIVSAHLDWAEVAGWLGCATAARRLEVLERAAVIGEGRPGWLSGVLSLRASIMREQTRLDEAIELGAEAIRTFMHGAPGSTLASHRQQHADILQAKGHYERAELQYMTILTDETRSARDEKSAYVGLARCALQRGDFAEARRRAETAVEVAAALGDSAMCGALDVLAGALCRTGDLDHAAAVADQLVDRARRLGQRARLFHALRCRLDVAIEAEDQEGARAWLEEAEVVARALDATHGGSTYVAALRARSKRIEQGKTH